MKRQPRNLLLAIWILFSLTVSSSLFSQVLYSSPGFSDNAVHGKGSAFDLKVDFTTSIMKNKGILLLFLNPKGRPCQMQVKILEENKTEIEKRFLIRHITTTNPENRSVFYRFGIRGLPAIILLNSNGTIYHRFPPGIQFSEQLLGIIQQKK